MTKIWLNAAEMCRTHSCINRQVWRRPAIIISQISRRTVVSTGGASGTASFTYHEVATQFLCVPNVFSVKIKLPMKLRPSQNSSATHFWDKTHQLRNAVIARDGKKEVSLLTWRELSVDEEALV